MNISTLSQQLNMSTKELREKMQELGYKVNPRQRKIDNQVATEVIEKLGAKIDDQEAKSAETSEKKISIPVQITVKELADRMQVPVVELIRHLINNGVMAAMHEEIDFDTASIVASEFGFELESQVSEDADIASSGYVEEVVKREMEDEEKAKDFVERAPIVTIMGHVDHGKTSLLDKIRQTNVAGQEAGAITQHLAAYQVKHNQKTITFIDTPGHEAFSQMRARGANVTDLIVLVVAADDGVKPQTVEVINRVKLAGVPMIVAVNKMDKPEAKPDMVKQQLAEYGVQVEDWGGDTVSVPLSAKTGEGLDKLLDMILLVTEMEDLKANPKGETVGTVIESHVAKGKGPIATVIIQNGTLRQGDFIVAGGGFAKIRTLEDAAGKEVKSAGPSEPVAVAGLSELPSAGDILRKVSSLNEAKIKAAAHSEKQRQSRLIHSGIKVQGKSVNLIIKADVQGSLQAIEQALEEVNSRTDEVDVLIVDKGVGNISESDILRAESSGATVLGFNVSVTSTATTLAKSKGINIDVYTVIYELIEDVSQAVLNMLSPEIVRKREGNAKVLAVFKTSGDEQIIGGRVEDGRIKKDADFVIKRNGEEAGTGKISELQKNKQEASEISSGSEFGMKVKVDKKIKEGDVLEFYSEEVKKRQLG